MARALHYSGQTTNERGHMLNILKQFFKYRLVALASRRLGWMFTLPMLLLAGYRMMRRRA